MPLRRAKRFPKAEKPGREEKVIALWCAEERKLSMPAPRGVGGSAKMENG